jgi:DNA-binding beta-propeller fold protein YncE
MCLQAYSGDVSTGSCARRRVVETHTMSRKLAVFLVALGGCASAPTYLVARDDTALPAPSAACPGEVIALTNHHYLTLAASCPSGARWRYRPDLSYHPANASPAAGPFVKVDFFVLRAGTQGEAESLAKEHAEIDRAVGVRHAWDIFTIEEGPDAPTLVQVVRAESHDAFERERAASEAQRGARIRSVYERVGKIVREVRSVEGRVLDTNHYTIEELRLPGANGIVTLDYFAFDRATGRLWVPAGNTASVDVIEGTSIQRIEGFATAEIELHGKRGRLGPSSVSLGDGVVFVGNRADRKICALDAFTQKTLDCLAVAGPTDGWAAAPDAVVYVAATKELWVTRGFPPLGIASSDRALAIIDASNPSALRPKGTLPLDASAEGYAVDVARGLFYTSLEETGETIAIDVRTRTIRGRWRSGCKEPHGLALERARGLVFVACDDRVVTLDAAHDGAVVDTIETGAGVDNIDYDDDAHLVYAAASDAATLTIARVDDAAHFHHVATVATARSARVVVAGANGAIFVADPLGGRILKIRRR